MKMVDVFCLAFVIYLGASYVTNFVRFVKLDFAEPYKAEVLRGIGIATPLFLVTAFADIGEENEE